MHGSKVVLVTDATDGLGRRVARDLAARQRLRALSAQLVKLEEPVEATGRASNDKR